MNKSLIEIKGRKLIEWQLDLFKSVEDLRIVVGFQSDLVKRAVLRIRKNAVFIENRDYETTKTGASLYLGAIEAHEYVIAWDGDLLVHPDDAQACFHQPDAFVGYSEIGSSDAMLLSVNNSGQVTGFSRSQGNFEWTGPAGIQKKKLGYTTQNVFNLLEPYLPLPGLKIRAMDIDDQDDYQRAIRFVEQW